jgi:RNA-directed DNA polymerase
MAKLLTVGETRDSLTHASIGYFSQHVLGLPYDAVRALIYPLPRYRAFLIAKRDGSPRLILEPRRQLKDVQLKALAFLVDRSGPPKPCVHGFVGGRSILSNAEQHLGIRPYHLLNIDLKDFFPSISFYRVRGVFRNAPFNLSHEVATVLAQLCTFGNALPQGAPTSPHLSNLVCRSLDRDLTLLAKRHRATYTRYVDDLSFSFSVRDPSRLPINVCSFDAGLVTLGNELREIIQDRHHFQINPTKTRLSTRFSRMEVTGITINEFPNVKRDFVDRIRGALNAWRKYGYIDAQAAWDSKVTDGHAKSYEERLWRRQTRRGEAPELKNVIWGKLLHVRMVRGKEDSLYTRLAELYNELCDRERATTPGFESPSLPVGQIVRNAADAERAIFVFEWRGEYMPPGAPAAEVVGSQGTAFAYKQSTQLITCAHVLQCVGHINGAPVTVDCASADVQNLSLSVRNPTTGAVFPVAVARSDPGRDLAVLLIPGPPPNHRHFNGMESPLNRNETGLLIGFPNWTPGRVANQTSAVVSNRFVRSSLRRFEISAPIRQGNSGGPFVDSLYRVAGVAQQGATQQSGNDECLEIGELDAWLNSAPAIPALRSP